MILPYDDDTIVKNIMEKYEIPFDLKILNQIKRILNNYEIKSVEHFDEIVQYLKKRSERDIFGRYPNDPLFQSNQVADWLFYLDKYDAYLNHVLKCCNLWDRKKFLFPDDVYDVVYCFNKDDFAFNYLKENYDLCSD